MKPTADISYVESELAKPMPREVVKHDNDRGLDYVDFFYVSNELNRIFGATRWRHEVVSHAPAMDPLHENEERQGRNGPYTIDRYVCGHRTHVRLVFLDFPELTKEDYGFGRGFGKYLVDAEESAQKESITDAIKRASRHLGPRFNALYDKTQSMVRDPDLAPELVWTGPHRGKPLAKASLKFLKTYSEEIRNERPDADAKHLEAIAARIKELEDEETARLAGSVNGSAA